MRVFFIFAFSFSLVLAALGQTPPPAPPAAPAAPAAPGAAAPLNLDQEMETLYSEATTAFNQGKFDVAVQKIGAIHEKTANKDFPAVMFLEGAAYYNLEQYDKAAEFLGKFVKTFPTEETIHEAKMNLGRALLKLGKEEEGVAVLKEVAAIPTLRDQAGLEIALYYKNKKKPDEAIGILEIILKDLTGAPNQEQQQAILMAAEIYVSKNDSDKAAQMMEKLRAGSSAEDSVVQLNNLGVKVGDSMMEQTRYREALLAYQSVRRHSEIVNLQKTRIAKIEQWIKQINGGGKVYFLSRVLTKDEATEMLTSNKAILEELQKATDYDASIYYRLGQCFYELARYYESILAFKKIYDEFPEFKDLDRCLFGMIICNAALKRSSRAADLCELYMAKFPAGANLAQVTDMLGSLLYEAGRVNDAVRVFKRAIAAPNADKERLNYLLGGVLFESQQFDESRAALQEVLNLNKESNYKDEVLYRLALSYFFQNDSKNARRSLRDYVAANAKGLYVVDARYRLAFIDYQAGDKEAAREELDKLSKEHPNDQNIGQVFSLLGDIYSQMQPDPKKPEIDPGKLALDAYRSAVEKAQLDDVLNYAIDAATNLMVDRNQWADIASMWSTYYNTHKDTPTALKAIHWISRAKEREAKMMEVEKKLPADAMKKQLAEAIKQAPAELKAKFQEEAKKELTDDALRKLLADVVNTLPQDAQIKIAEETQTILKAEAQKKLQEARVLVAEALIPHLGSPANEQVEVLLQQLVTMMVPKKRARSKTASPDGAPAPKEVTFEDVEAELKKLVTPDGDNALVNGTAAARMLYARATLARIMKDIPKYENLVSIIPDAAKPEELSPLLLSTLGDMLVKKGEVDKATTYFNILREKYAASEFADKAPVGLGQIEFDKGDFTKALEYFNEAIEKYAASSSILDATLGKAKTLFAMKRFDEAEALYKTIFSTQEWRGEAHAIALFMQGQIEEARKEQEKAISFYQRAFISQRRYKEWMAKSYLQAAKCSLEINKREDAQKLLREMLAREDIQDQPAFREAQQLLGTISG